MTTVFLKPTVRPCPSVSRPSSRICSRKVEHVGMCFLDLVEQQHRVRTAPHGLGEVPAFLVAHVAGRRPDEPGHGVPLLELAHVHAHHGLLVVEQELGQSPAEFRLAHAGGA